MSDIELIDEERFGTAQEEAIDEESVARALVQLEGLEDVGERNTKVVASGKYEDIKDDYIRLMRAGSVRPEHLGTPTQKYSVRWYAAQIVANEARYDRITARTQVPWYAVGVLHALECSFSFEKHLFNGDSLSDYTKRHPPGYPRTLGRPPFDFEDSAVAALDYDKMSYQTDWSMARTLFRFEKYNGMGYRKRLEMASPYLWSFTSHYTAGKFKEVLQSNGTYKSIYDPNLKSKQCGAAAMLRQLIDDGHVTFPTS